MSNHYTIDESHTHAQFSVRHMMVSNVRGEFGKLEGEAVIDDQNPERSSIKVSIDAGSINSRDARRDEHLRSADFLDVAKFPKLSFASKRVRRRDGKLEVAGNLTIRGVTHEVTLDVEELTELISDPWGKQRRGARASTTIDRKAFDLNWNAQLDKGGVVVGDKVLITLEVELIRD